MNKMALRIALVLAALAAATVAQAQPRRNYDVKPMNFELWCQESLALPAERCLKRLPADVAAFETHSAQIQAYEIPHLQQKNRQAQIEANILHSDPVDRSPLSVLQAQGNAGTLTPPTPRTVP
jgi:hypothetical protein